MEIIMKYYTRLSCNEIAKILFWFKLAGSDLALMAVVIVQQFHNELHSLIFIALN